MAKRISAQTTLQEVPRCRLFKDEFTPLVRLLPVQSRIAMKYVSTRGCEEYTFEEAVLLGWARDGGMLLPKTLPLMSKSELNTMKGKTYQEVACIVLRRFIDQDTIDDVSLKNILAEAFQSFGDPSTVTKTALFDGLSVVELWHGPTLAFKDLGMQVLAKIMDFFLRRRGEKRIILVGTSGDTGSSACEAIAGMESMQLVVLYPGGGRISAVQELQMTRCKALDAPEKYSNIHVVAVEGNSDDLDVAIEANLKDISKQSTYGLASVNSVNIVRVLMQTVSFFYVCTNSSTTCSTSSEKEGVCDPSEVEEEEEEELPTLSSFFIPTGAAGHLVAAAIAHGMGLSLRAYAATNANDCIQGFLRTGVFAQAQMVVQTAAPAMDIQVP